MWRGAEKPPRGRPSRSASPREGSFLPKVGRLPVVRHGRKCVDGALQVTVHEPRRVVDDGSSRFPTTVRWGRSSEQGIPSHEKTSFVARKNHQDLPRPTTTSLESFKSRVAENVPGRFYVGYWCTDCDLCRATAPSNFGRVGRAMELSSAKNVTAALQGAHAFDQPGRH